MPKTPTDPSAVLVYYNVLDATYWMDVSGRYLALKKGDLFDDITAQFGITHKGEWISGLSPLDWIVYNARKTRQIDYAGSLAGHRTGVSGDGSGRSYLVTDEARGVFDKMPKEFDDPQFFIDFVTELLPGEQSTYFFYWLAVALRSLRKGDFRPGQFCILAGAVQCGKSLLQYIITEIFGGRAASPMRYMMEETAFNKDLAGAEHWMIEEPKTGTDTRTRVAFGASLKEGFNNEMFSIHGKGKEAITLRLWRRGTISVNDEPDLLQVLPPLNGSIDDKMMLFHCAKATKALEPFNDANGDQQRAKIREKYMSEVPAIRAWLLKHFTKVPVKMRDPRFGVAAYHHPDLRERLVSFTQEMRLLNIIDEILFGGEGPHAVKRGRAMELENEFCKSELGGRELGKMLRYANQFASLLGKLAKIEPKRVTKTISAGYATWEIHPPEKQTETNLV